MTGRAIFFLKLFFLFETFADKPGRTIFFAGFEVRLLSFGNLIGNFGNLVLVSFKVTSKVGNFTHKRVLFASFFCQTTFEFLYLPRVLHLHL